MNSYWIGLRRYKYFLWLEPPYGPITYANWKNPDDGDQWISKLKGDARVKVKASSNHVWEEEENDDKEHRVICQTPKDTDEGMTRTN